MIIAALAALALQSAAAPESGSAPAVTGSPAPRTDPAKPKDPIVCRDEAPIGSLLKRTVCVRHSVEEARARSAQAAVDRMTTGGPVKDPTR